MKFPQTWPDRIKLGIVSCGFLGCSPFAPGTFGTLGGVALAWAIAGSEHYLALSLAFCVALYLLTRPLGPWAEAYAGRKDPGIFVMDEVIGYLITMCWMRGPSTLALVVGFFVFRALDVLKPYPANRLEAVGGGDGILLDDVMAGVWGLCVMAAARLLWPGLPWHL